MKDKNRRPLASRNTNWAHALTAYLANTGITPNQISMCSVFFALVAGSAFAISGMSDGATRVVLLLIAVSGCQLRLLCNLLDGMVAVEAGKQSADGAIWNEVPDRFADILILVGCGYGVGAPALGWAAATFAVLTAYVRELGVANRCDADFAGPMAKPHRMAALTLGGLLAILEPLWSTTASVLLLTLWVVAAGALFTAFRRIVNLFNSMR